jgi:hypothetical protein
MSVETATDDVPIPANLVAALAKVQAEIPDVEKDRIGRVRSEKANYTYRYADLSAVTDAILPLLGRNGLAWVTQPTMTASGFVLRYTLLHESGESITGEYPLPDPARVGPQQVGSALTYARRYCLCAVTGVAPGEDDDDAAAADAQWHRSPTEADRPPTRRRRSSTAGPIRPSAAPMTDERREPADTPNDDADHPDGDGENANQVDPSTIRRIQALFGGAGFKRTEADRARRLRACGLLVGHDVNTATDLTEAEGKAIIAAFGEHRADVSGWLARLLGETDPDDQTPEDPTDDSDDTGSGDDG